MKKIIAAAGLIAVIALAVAAPASAGTNASANGSARTAVSINPAGKVHLAGAVTAVSASSLTVASWLGNWTVNIGADTRLSANTDGKNGKEQIAIGQIRVGDRVAVDGAIASGMTVSANSVIDVSLNPNAPRKILAGVISNLNAAARSFTLTLKNDTTATVNLASDASLRIGKTVTTTVASLQNGMRVSVSGEWNQSTNTLLGKQLVGIDAATAAKVEAKHDHDGKANGGLKLLMKRLLGWR